MVKWLWMPFLPASVSFFLQVWFNNSCQCPVGCPALRCAVAQNVLSHRLRNEPRCPNWGLMISLVLASFTAWEKEKWKVKGMVSISRSIAHLNASQNDSWVIEAAHCPLQCGHCLSAINQLSNVLFCNVHKCSITFTAARLSSNRETMCYTI